jgi:hypothetical protein
MKTETLKTIITTKGNYYIKAVIKQTTSKHLLTEQYILFTAKHKTDIHNFKQKIKLGFAKELNEIEQYIEGFIKNF